VRAAQRLHWGDMSSVAKPGPTELGSRDGPDTADALPIGIDPLLSSCVIKTKSGSKYYSSLGVLATCSPVFKGLVECCGQNQPSDGVAQQQCRDSKSLSSTPRAVMEIPLDDPEEQIKELVEHLHQPERFLGSVIPIVTEEGTTRILNLAPIAFKYDIQGTSVLFCGEAGISRNAVLSRMCFTSPFMSVVYGLCVAINLMYDGLQKTVFSVITARRLDLNRSSVQSHGVCGPHGL
jgi:hypothetical protein